MTTTIEQAAHLKTSPQNVDLNAGIYKLLYSNTIFFIYNSYTGYYISVSDTARTALLLGFIVESSPGAQVDNTALH